MPYEFKVRIANQVDDIITSATEKIIDAKKYIDNNRILSYMIENYDSYVDLDGNLKQELIPNYIEYTYKRIELIINEVFQNDSYKDLMLTVSAMYKHSIEKNSGNAMNQEKVAEKSTDLAIAMSDAIGGANIFESIAIFKYHMVYALSVKEEITEEMVPVAQKSFDIILQNKCVVCKDVAFSKCGQCKTQTYCSKNCQKKHWKYHKLDCIRSLDC